MSYVLPRYPYELLDGVREVATAAHGRAIDLSIGTPHDAPPAEVVAALSRSNAERGYPPSIGTPRFRQAATAWLSEQFGAAVDPADVGATIGLKEFVAGLPNWMHLRDPERDTILFPSVSYPSYEMGADLAQCRAVPVPVDGDWRLRLDAIDPADVDRALLLWVNSPGNPAGAIEDLAAAADWGRDNGVPVFSDECYIEFTWGGPGRTILEHGTDGVVAVHSLSKRSNLAGVRAGFYAGDTEIVHWLQEIRKHVGAMVPGPSQAAAVVALGDQRHVDRQRERYRHRLETMIGILDGLGVAASMPGGGFYLWVRAPEGDSWAFADRLARELGIVVAPGEFYGEDGAGHVRLAMVCPDDDMVEVGARAGRLASI